MTASTTRGAICWSVVTLGLALSVFSEYLGSSLVPGWLGTVWAEVATACRDPGTQWMVAACLATYFLAFLFLEARFGQERPWRKAGNPNFWLMGLVAVALT